MTLESPRPGLLRRTLRRRWVPILTQWAILTVALFAAAYVLIGTSYRASSLIRIDPQKDNIFGGQSQGETLDAFLKTQVELITSPNVLSAAATSPKAAKLPLISSAGDVVQELRKMMTVQIVPETYLIEVSISSRSASEAATLVNAVVDAFMASSIEWSDGMTRSQIKNLETYLVELKDQTDVLERRWKELIALGDTGRNARKANLLGTGHAAKIEEKLIENDLKRVEAQAQLDQLKGREVKDPKKIEELESELETIRTIDRALNERLALAGFDPNPPRTLEVEIELIREQRASYKEMQEAVIRRLEQLRFEARGEARVRPMNMAVPPGRPLERWYRPWVLVGIPFATFAVTLGLFAGIEARSRSSDRSADEPLAPSPRAD